MITLTNIVNQQKITLPDKDAKKFFGLKAGMERIMCLPVSEMIEDIHESKMLQPPDEKYKRKLPGTAVIRMGGLGDLIMLSSGLYAYKKRHPKELLTVVTIEEHMPYVKSLPFVDKVMSTMKLGKYKWEKTIDLRFSVEPPQLGTICKGKWEDYIAKDRSDVFDELLGVHPAEKKFLAPSSDFTETIQDAIEGSHPVVAINASMVAPARSILPAYIKPLCDYVLKRTDFHIVLFGVSQHWNRELKGLKGVRVHNLIDQTSLGEMTALCSHADLVVTPDTGTLHVAGALGTRTIALFGGINPRTRISYYPNVRALYPHGKKSCIPCWDIPKCMNGKPEVGSPCMRLLTPKVIGDAIIEEHRRLGI